MNGRRLPVLVIALLLGCTAIGHRPSSPNFTQGVWRLRIDVDSAPSRVAPRKPVFGTIDFATARYVLDFQAAINRRLPNGAYIAALAQPERYRPAVYKITLGDSSSFDEKVVLVGRAVTNDSIVGTWSETILCCSAGGRFSLWRDL